ncbi:MAG: ammonium transporter [Reichenbachiella sp.]|uniref:ammonium transporter n=1 Tax=Reichenbachiella sp. TaxID=2184521 RepID=UPI0032971073
MINLLTNVVQDSVAVAEAPVAVVAEVPVEVTAAVADAAAAGATALFTANNIWMMLATALVFIMHLGFAGVEAGFGQSKNTVNILFKNTITPIIGLITYMICGFNLMYPGDFGIIDGVLGFAGFGLDAGDGASIDYAGGGYTYWTDFLFQGMFAATAATIVSGAIAERVKLSSYMIFTVLYVGIVYPILGSWKWGAGFLDAAGFYDFAGSTLVHSVGGWGALAGIIVIGPRLGKYVDGKVIDKPGTSVPLAVIGVFLLWLGWFGFNGGSVLSADPDLVSFVLVTTCMAACTGGLFGFLTAYVVFKRMDLGMVLNGILAGLVGITAGADVISVNNSLIVGAVAGIIVVLSAILLDKLKLDDVVGAVSVHLSCGIWGTLAVGIFGGSDFSFMTQLYGVVMYAIAAFPIAFILFFILKKTVGVRVSEQHETEGLDTHEHGIRGYTIVYDE